jgi:hypothetical protein
MRFLLLAISMVIGACVVVGQEKSRYTQLSGGILTYGPITKELGYTFRAVHSLNVNPNFSAGLGLGFEKYMLNETDGHSFTGLPLFAQAKYVLNSSKKRSLFGAFDLGYSISLNKPKEWTDVWEKHKASYSGGLLASPQIGVLWYTKDKKSHFTFSLGYNYQGFNEKMYTGWLNNQFFSSAIKSDVIPDGYDNYTKNKYHLNRLSVMLGIGF